MRRRRDQALSEPASALPPSPTAFLTFSTAPPGPTSASLTRDMVRPCSGTMPWPPPCMSVSATLYRSYTRPAPNPPPRPARSDLEPPEPAGAGQTRTRTAWRRSERPPQPVHSLTRTARLLAGRPPGSCLDTALTAREHHGADHQTGGHANAKVPESIVKHALDELAVRVLRLGRHWLACGLGHVA